MSRRNAQSILGAVLALALLAAAGIIARPHNALANDSWHEKVDQAVLVQMKSEGQTEFILLLADQADLTAADSLPTKHQKGQFVYQALAAAAEGQASLLAQLNAQNVEHHGFWIVNMVWVRTDDDLILAQLAQRPDVAHIFANPYTALDRVPAGAPAAEPAGGAVEWNLDLVSAPAVWAEGVTGEGVVIAGADTGYDWDHPALQDQYRGWDGISADHNYNWHDAIHSGGGSCGANTQAPCEDFSHGSHTMGTMVGDDGGSNQVGMAPGARWIGCRNMNVGVGSPTTYSECFQWLLAPTDLNGQNPRPDLAPHIINNSWSCPVSEGCTDPDVLKLIVENLRAAGILVVVSAGNSGSACSTVSTPAAIYGASFSVGATDISDAIAGFSSRGPVTFDSSGRMKPNISAPGVSVRSSVNGGGYSTSSGTSMAGPHVAGLAALLIEAAPELAGNIDLIETIIESTAVPLTTSEGCGGDGPTDVPNNTYGWGRIDALAAYDLAVLNQTISISKTAHTIQVAPGDLLTYTLTISREAVGGLHTQVRITDVLPGNTSLVSASGLYTFTGSSVVWTVPAMDEGEAISRQLVVRVSQAALQPVLNWSYSVSSDQHPPVSGPALITSVSGRSYLPAVFHHQP
jgi:uncharacterized repeat protein (TIGR01451 family)